MKMLEIPPYLSASEIARRIARRSGAPPRRAKLLSRLRRSGVPRASSGNRTRWLVSALPADLLAGLGVRAGAAPAAPVDPPPTATATSRPAEELSASEIAALAGCCRSNVMALARKHGTPYRMAPRRDALGRNRPVRVYDAARLPPSLANRCPGALPAPQASALEPVAEESEPPAPPPETVPCDCGAAVPADALLDCWQCGRAVCAECWARDRCRSCRKLSQARRRRDRARLARAAAALDANRALRGDCPAEEIHA